MYKKNLKALFSFCVIVIILLIVLNGCNALKQAGSTTENDYKEIKQMVTDILQTEDSKKIILESLQDSKAKNKLVMNNEEVKTIVENELLSPANQDYLKKLYEDPEFTAKLSEALKKENDKLMKELMKDPEYRKMLIETMNDDDFKKIIFDVMNSNKYRSEMMVVIKDTFETPTFKNELLKLIEKAAKNVLEPAKK